MPGNHDAAIAFCEDAIEDVDMLFALFNQWLPDFEAIRLILVTLISPLDSTRGSAS